MDEAIVDESGIWNKDLAILNAKIPPSEMTVGFGFGADERSRTPDLRITNALLYQLSYIGLGRNCIRAGLISFDPQAMCHF